MTEHKYYIPTKEEGKEIRVSVSFRKGGVTYTGQVVEAGYFANVVPVEISHRNGATIEEFGAFTGFNKLLLGCGRRSQKRLEEAIKIAEENKENYLKYFEV